MWRFKYKRNSKPHAIYFNTTRSIVKQVRQVQLQRKQTGDEDLSCLPKGRGTVRSDQVSEHWSVRKVSSFVILSPGIFPRMGCLGHKNLILALLMTIHTVSIVTTPVSTSFKSAGATCSPRSQKHCSQQPSQGRPPRCPSPGGAYTQWGSFSRREEMELSHLWGNG